MSQVFSSIGKAFMGGGGGGFDWGKLLNLGTGVMGLISSIGSNKQKNRLINDAVARQKYLQSLTPEQHAQGIRRFQKPLSGGLTSGVENLVQASMMERGLGQAPGIFSEVMAQALAPYLMQQQDRAQDAYWKHLAAGGDGTGFLQAAGMYTSPSTTSIWRDLLSRFNPTSIANPIGGSRASIPYPTSPDPGGLIYSRPTGDWWSLFGGGNSGGSGFPSLEDFYAENPG